MLVNCERCIVLREKALNYKCPASIALGGDNALDFWLVSNIVRNCITIEIVMIMITMIIIINDND